MSKAAFLAGSSRIYIGNDTESPDNYSLKIKIDACAICGSDLRIYKSGNARISYPAVIGHEICGSVVDSKHSGFRVGDKISLGADIPCGKCKPCLQGKPNHCQQNLAIGYQLKGGFSEFLYISDTLVNSGPIVKVVDNPNYPFITCLAEPLACAINGIDKIRLSSNSKTLIYGGGPIGLMIAEIVQRLYSPEKVVVVETSDYRRKFIRKVLPKASVIESDHNLEEEERFDFIFTCCSAFQTHLNALRLIENGGSINFFGGLPQPAPSMEVCTNDLHYKEITLTGSHGSTPAQHKLAVEMITENCDFYQSLITHTFSLDEINAAFELGLSGNAMKIVITP